MLIKDQNNNEFYWNPIKEAAPREDYSKLHIKAKLLLEENYPTTLLLEEVYVPRWKFRFDFIVPLFRIAVEVQGQQHYQYSSFYHASKLDFIKQKKKDVSKQTFCKVNHFKLIELPHWEKEEEWKVRINEY